MTTMTLTSGERAALWTLQFRGQQAGSKEICSMSEKNVKVFKLSEPEEARPSSQGCPLTFLLKKEKITCGSFAIPPGKRLGRISAHSGDEVYYVLKGTLWVDLPRYEETVEVKENEGFYMAGGTIHAPHNLHGSEETLVLWFCTPDWY